MTGPQVIAVNEDRSAPIDLDRWGSLARDVLVDAGVAPPAELNLLFVDEAAMAELNETHMGHEGPTDVLSFPLDGVDGPDEPTLDSDRPLLVGDVVVCPAVARRNAPDHAGTYDDELALLVVHGVLHVLGMDHAEPDEEALMQARERDLLARYDR